MGFYERCSVSSSPPIRSVVRALEVLQALNRQAVSTLDMLYEQTRIPKPTIVRMLQTFEGRGVVKHAPQHGAYYLTSGVRSLTCGYHSEPMIVEAAAPLMDALTLRVKWPTAIAVLDNHAMVVRYSTIPLSPLALKHSTINVRLSLVSRATGRAYLAFCSPEQQDTLLAALAQSSAPEDEGAQDPQALRRILAEVREAGYALRKPQVVPASNTLAVPVFDSHGVAASLGLTFFASTLQPRYLTELQGVAAEIGERLRKLQAG
jgi:IclR family transcriptional regulator, mhp operon transcriptional activator